MTETGHFRIATFNLKHGAKTDGYMGNPDLVAEACAEIDADILALQEVDRYIWRSRFADLVQRAVGDTYTQAYFAQAMGANALAGINPGGQYGNALLVKGRIDNVEEIPVLDDYIRLKIGNRRYEIVREPRNAILADVYVGGHKIAVAATHLGGKARQQQLSDVVAPLDLRPGSRILMGDLNTERKNTRAWLGSTSLTLVESPPTCPAPEPKRSIDHIATHGLVVHSIEARILPVSDHLALIADVSIDPHGL